MKAPWAPGKSIADQPRKTLRADHPTFKPATRGSSDLALTIASSPRKRDAAEAELVEDVEAATTKRARTLKLAKWDQIACHAGLCKTPPGAAQPSRPRRMWEGPDHLSTGA